MPALRRYALALTRNQADADDLVQEALLRGHEGRRSFRPGGNLRSWLFSILRNAFLDRSRSRKAEARREAAQSAGGVQQERAREKSAAEVEAERQRAAGEAVVEARTRSEVREATDETKAELTEAQRAEQQAEERHRAELADASEQEKTADQLRAEAARLGDSA